MPIPTESTSSQKPAPAASGRSASLVAAGIFLSRIAGLIRERVFAHYFGNSDTADVFRAAIRIPNFLQNLFGEGVLSASFIPVYARLRALGKDEEASDVADAVATLLALVTAVLVLIGVLATPYIIDAIAPGFHGAKRELTIRLVRILFPGAGLLVMSAWCLGILNSHRKFFLSYAAPVAWNAVMIATLIGFGRNHSEESLAVITAWGSVAGSALQLGVQLPVTLRLIGRLRIQLALQLASVHEVVRNFFPVLIGRGVVQLSAYVDSIIASYLPTGAVAALGYAQILYTLPISLFGMSVSAAELPAMSGTLGSDSEIAAQLRTRLGRALRQIAFLVVPSAMAFLILGDVVSALIYQSGRFTHENAIYVWGILAGSAVGLLASSLGRLYSSTYYALRDTRTPLRFAMIRVALTTLLGLFCALRLPQMVGIDRSWGVAGLTASAGVAGWIEFLLLRWKLHQRIGAVAPASAFLAKLWFSALISAAVGFGIKLAVGHRHPILVATAVLIPYGVLYFLLTSMVGIPETQTVLRRLRSIID
ncbi:MAG: murein biosynthesis integral membrane protein MurJ [Acidobacteria bacterium]|nr:MAG: murein biosynthesis integral membrane protein MurJ [Acidobacteriota bacterium]PYY21455.1 MAG: murein biosynthesis integral membrane protein MurJ [Acidobacteriota bacterium]